MPPKVVVFTAHNDVHANLVQLIGARKEFKIFEFNTTTPPLRRHKLIKVPLAPHPSHRPRANVRPRRAPYARRTAGGFITLIAPPSAPLNSPLALGTGVPGRRDGQAVRIHRHVRQRGGGHHLDGGDACVPDGTCP